MKIVDFGIAGIVNNFNVDQMDVGSLSYMAPEILTGRAKKLGPSIDVWALGVILYGLVFDMFKTSFVDNYHLPNFGRVKH